MKRTIIVFGLALLAVTACGRKPAEKPVMDNPFFSEFATPFGVPPFDEIKPEHYMPAFERGMAEQKKEIAAIAACAEAPTFANTIEALERSGALLTKVTGVFGNMTARTPTTSSRRSTRTWPPCCPSTPTTSSWTRRSSPGSRPSTTAGARWRSRPSRPGCSRRPTRTSSAAAPPWTRQEGGAAADQRGAVRPLGPVRRERPQGEQRASSSSSTAEEDLAGLPPAVVAGAAEAAKANAARRASGSSPCTSRACIPFLQYSAKRELREKLFKAYHRPGRQRQRADNKAIARRSPPCASSGPTCSATRPTPTTSSKRTWPRRRPASTACSTSSGRPPWPWPRPKPAELQELIRQGRRAASSSRPGTGGTTPRS